jgi:SAM-dependent methyltransferase
VVIVRDLARRLIYQAPGECERCPACGSPRLFELDLLMLRKVVDGRRMGFVSGCDECGLVFCNPQPSASTLEKLYSPEGDWGAPRAAEGAPPARPTGTSWARVFEPIGESLRIMSPPAGAAVLDFGCGDGRMLDALQDCGWKTFGIEPALDRPFRRHTRLHVVPDRPSFDLILANQVLEHVSNPLAVLKQFAGAARPAAFLLVSVPRFDTLPLHRDYKYVLNGHAHVTAYTWSCMQTLLARAGWSPVANPPDEISKGGGRRTRARLRVIARRAEAPVAHPDAPAAAARMALRDYYAAAARPALQRLGLFRLAARQSELNRLRALRAAKHRRTIAPMGRA